MHAHNRELVSVTTIREGDGTDPAEKVRAEIFLDTASEHCKRGVDLLAVYADCSLSYLKKLRKYGVTLIEQSVVGMGSIRRQALFLAKESFPTAKYFLWLEPEKPQIISLALGVLGDTSRMNAVACFFNRTSMHSYPIEQAHYYLFCRAVASGLVGADFDYGFGPMLLSKLALVHFLEYNGEYGDLWDSILIPRLKIIRSGLPYRFVSIDFINDPRMTAIESNNSRFILKRVTQLQNVVPSLIAEWSRQL